MPRKPRLGQCAICGMHGDVTREHLPPAKLYSANERAALQMNIIKACLRCNNGGSSDDENLKILLGLVTGDGGRNANQIIDHLASTLEKNKILQTTIFEGRLTNTPTGRQIAIEFDQASYCRSVTRITKGLYFSESGKALGLAAWVSVFEPSNSYIAVDNALRSMPRKSLNGGTFTYAHQIFEDGGSVWQFNFFNRHEVLAWTGPPVP